MMPTKWPPLVLTLFVLTSVEAFAFNTGEQVYVKTQPDTWMPATYVGQRDDCFRAESAINARIVALKAPSDLIKGKIEIGAEIFFAFQETPSDYKGKYFVRDVQLSCHVVEKLGEVWAGRAYALLGDVIPATEFIKSIGLKKTLDAGGTVYARNPTYPESWSLYKIVSKQNSCFETDSEKVLSIRDFEYGEFYSAPTTPVKNPTAGNTVFIRTSFAPDVWVKVKLKIKKKKKMKLTLLLPYVDSEEDFFEEEIDVGDIRVVPPRLSEPDFFGLKSGATVLQMVDPQACAYVSYVPRKIVAVKNDCYALRRTEYGDGFETETYLSEKLIEAKLLTTGRAE